MRGYRHGYDRRAMTAEQGRRAVFLDRDGTLNKEVGYLRRREDFEWIPGAPEAVRSLNEAGLLTIVVTNQAGVGQGYFTEEDVRRLHSFMQSELAAIGAHIDAFYYCPYHPRADIDIYRGRSIDRKPGTGMFDHAIRHWSIDPSGSFVVGDRSTDLAPGRLRGMTTMLVETGYGAAEKEGAQADYVAKDIGAAIATILRLSV